MRTLIILTSGFVLLAISLLLGRLAGGQARAAALGFIGLWLVLTTANGAFGVWKAGYTVKEEFPILLVLFIPPGATAFLLWRRLAR
jgi:hypothetical protein